MIKKARQILFSRWHYMLVDESEVISALKVLSECTNVDNAQKTFVRNAGYPNKPERWFISFTCYNREWSTVHNKLTSTIKNVEVLR